MNEIKVVLGRSYRPVAALSRAADASPSPMTRCWSAGSIAAESLIATDDAMVRHGYVARFFQSKLAALGHECPAFLYLDSQLKPIRYLEQAMGTLGQASTYPREIVKTALRLRGCVDDGA